MMTYEVLKKALEAVVDPGFNQPLKDVKGIKKLVVGPTGVAEVEIYLKDKQKHEQQVKIQIIKLVKIELGFPGIKIDFFESEFVPEGEKPIKYLAVASGKGGVGKSSVTANLAYALTRLGKKVGIIDADVYGASIPNIMKIGIKPLSSTDDEKMIPLSKDGVEVISTEFFMPPEKPLMWRGPMLGKMLVHFFSGVKWQDQIDIILIDLPPGTGDVALDVKTYVPKSKVLVVTTPHTNASHVAVKAGIGAQNIGHEVIGVVENMSYYLNPCNQKRDFIFGQGGGEEVAKKLGVPVLGQVPIGQPISGDFIFQAKEDAGKVYNELADKVIKEFSL
ncbi:MAG: chromosome partitioning protein ParA [Tenericutes bacterium HGW-Tenericutes-6]|nr:MAG: chromosome partitioning protein ParA [Tenericutes bacterium HGW-Tenericutes-6]